MHSVVQMWPDYKCHAHTIIVWEASEVVEGGVNPLRRFLGRNLPVVFDTKFKTSKNDLC